MRGGQPAPGSQARDRQSGFLDPHREGGGEQDGIAAQHERGVVPGPTNSIRTACRAARSIVVRANAIT